MSKYPEVKQFTLTQEPIIKDKVIILHAVDADNNREKCIFFPQFRDAKDTAIIKSLTADKTVFLEGKYQPDRRTGEMQFFVDKVANANKEQAVISDPVVIPGDISQHRQVAYKSNDITFEEAMAMPSKDLIPVEERRMEVKKYTFPDGKFFYSDGIDVWIKPDHKVKATYKFIEGYNQRVTSDKWLMPDWFSLEQIKIMKEDELNIKLLEVFATY